jgi:hypothetical protein
VTAARCTGIQAVLSTTEDPIRDGSNWFAYVNNDPVNWKDPWGLSANDARSLTQTEIAAHTAATFGTQPVNYDEIKMVEEHMPTAQEIKNAAAGVGIDLSQKKDEKLVREAEMKDPYNTPGALEYQANQVQRRVP